MKTLRQILQYRKGKPPKTDLNGTLPVLTPGYLRTGQVENLALPRTGDVVLNGGEIILLWDGSNAGEFFRAREGVLSSTMVVLDFDEEQNNSDYLYYDLKRFEPELKGRTAGSGIPHVDKDALLSHSIVERDPIEQETVAKVLAAIDLAIEQTQVLLAKQMRINAGLVHDLLTCGLDDQGDLRDFATEQSKLSSLDSIPSMWQIRTLDWCLHGIDAGKSPTCIDKPAGPGEWGVLKVSAVGPSGFIPSENKTLPHIVTPFVMAKVEPGDLLIQRSNTPELVGTACLVADVPDNLLLCDKTLRLNVNEERADKRYLLMVLQSSSIRRQIETAATGSSGSMKNIGQAAIRSLRFALPLIEEQNAIASHAARMTATISASNISLSKLRRLKAGLMQDLLTGRVPVTPLLALRNSP